MKNYCEDRPWGLFEVLHENDEYKVKRIEVKPGGKLSLQSHEHRSEHWVVVSGQAKITVDEKIDFYHKGQHIFIPLKSKHRLENESDCLVEIVEVQSGDYLGEDDITRYDDIYSRV